MRLLNRIGSGPSHFRCVLYVYTASQIALCLVYIFTDVFVCSPVHAYWTFNRIPGQKCANDAALMKTCAILNTISEFILGVFPIIGVYRLNVDRTQRRTVIGLLSLGFLVGFAGCFRTYFLWQSVSAPNLDLSWWADPHWIASEIEIDLAIVSTSFANLTQSLIGL
jgi:glycopeptide antibiotics resistance protein